MSCKEIGQGKDAVVFRDEESLNDAFDSARGHILKRFKLDKPLAFFSYQNEVEALTLLDRHRDSLSLSVPRLLSHRAVKHDEQYTEISIEMTALKNARNPEYIVMLSEKQIKNMLYFDGLAMAELHGLELTGQDQSAFTTSFVERLLSWLNLEKGSDKFSTDIKEMETRLKSMTGRSVFVHGDLMYGNTLGSENGEGVVTGVCDFCNSGIAPKELDFLMVFESEYGDWDIFYRGYLEGGGEEVQEKNMDILQSYVELKNKIQTNAFKMTLIAEQGERKFDV